MPSRTRPLVLSSQAPLLEAYLAGALAAAGCSDVRLKVSDPAPDVFKIEWNTGALTDTDAVNVTRLMGQLTIKFCERYEVSAEIKFHLSDKL